MLDGKIFFRKFLKICFKLIWRKKLSVEHRSIMIKINIRIRIGSIKLSLVEKVDNNLASHLVKGNYVKGLKIFCGGL